MVKQMRSKRGQKMLNDNKRDVEDERESQDEVEAEEGEQKQDNRQ